jgi:hypothetical protein
LNGPGDQINTDPMIGSLQDNGGPTFTHALLSGSSAIDAGGPHFAPPSMWAHLSAGNADTYPNADADCETYTNAV